MKRTTKGTNVQVGENGNRKAIPGFFGPGRTHIVLVIEGDTIVERYAERDGRRVQGGKP